MNDKVVCRSVTYHVLSIDFIKICIYIYITSEYITYVTQQKCLDHPRSSFTQKHFTVLLMIIYEGQRQLLFVVSKPAAFRHHFSVVHPN